MKKDSFVFRKEWRDAICGLPDEIRLEIYEAIIEYGLTGKLSDLKPMAMLAFNFAKVQIDKDVDKYNSTCAKRTEAIRKRWEQYKSIQNIQMNTKDTNHTDNDNDYDSDNDSDMSSSDEEQNKKKKSSKEDKKDAAHAATLLEGRKEDFYNSLIPFVDRYGRDMIRAFYDYWTEPNKSRTRMRFELERTWDVSRRLVTWASRDKQFNSNDTVRVNASEQRNADAAKNIASFLADD